MSTTADVDRPAAGHSWVDPSLVEQTWRSHLNSVAAVVLCLVIGSTIDLALIKPVIDATLRLDERLSWLVAVSLAVIAGFTAWSAGWFAKGWSATRRPSLGVALGSVAGWAAIGVALFLLRWLEADFQPAVVAFEGAAAAAAPDDSGHRMLAGIMTLVYLATGSAAFYGAFQLRNDAAVQLRRALARRQRLLGRLAVEEGHYRRLLGNLPIHRSHLAGLAKDRDEASRAVVAMNAQLKAHTRYRIAVELGTPSATGVIREGAAIAEPDER